MELRPVEKLMLLMLSEIYDALKINGEVDTAFLREAIFNGHGWAIDWKMSGIASSEETPKEVVTDVVNALNMYRIMEQSFNALTEAEREQVEDSFLLKFHGFDGNNETEHMSVAQMLVHTMGRFTEFAGRDMNSHAPTVDRTRLMHRALQPLMKELGSRPKPFLTLPEIEQVLAAGRHA